jgi:hypothetical protein
MIESLPLWIQLVLAITGLIVAVNTTISAIRGKSNSDKLDAHTAKLDVLKAQIDGATSRLVEVLDQAAHTSGILEGMKQEQARMAQPEK